MPKQSYDLSDLGAEVIPENNAQAPSYDLSDLGATPILQEDQSFPSISGSASPTMDDAGTLQTAKDLGLSALNAGSFGFADEAAGALAAGGKAAGRVISGEEQSLDKLLQDYRSSRDTTRDIYKQAEERSPTASMAGSLIGSLIPGLGTASAVAKGAKGLGLMAKIGQGIKAGIPAGAAFGLGQSEADLTKGEVLPAAADVGEGALMGGLTGGAIPLAGAAISAPIKGAQYLGKELPKQSEILSDVLESYRRGTQGQKLAGKANRRLLEESVNKEGENILNTLEGERKLAGKAREKILERAGEEGQTIDISSQLESAKKRAEQMPANTSAELKEKQTLLDFINDKLYSTEEKTRAIKAGPTIKSGEETTLEKLLGKKFKTEAEQLSGSPEKMAEARLRDTFAKQESNIGNEAYPFINENLEKMSSTAGPDVLRSPGPNENILSQVIKNKRPGEIQSFKDPITGKNLMGYLDELTGKFVSEPVPEIYGQTPIAFEKYQQQIPKNTLLSPTKAQELERSVSGLTQLGETPLKSQPALRTVSQLEKGLKGSIRDMPKYGESVKKSDQLYSSVKQAQDILFPSTSAMTAADRSSIEKSLASTIRKLETDTQAGISTRKVVEDAFDALSKTKPELADKMKTRMLDKASAYDIARKIGAESAIQGRLTGTIQGITLGGSNLLGQAVGSTKKVADTMLKNKTAFIKGATPDILKDVASKIKDSSLSQKIMSIADAPEQRRQALLFSLLQNPGYREALGLSKED